MRPPLAAEPPSSTVVLLLAASGDVALGCLTMIRNRTLWFKARFRSVAYLNRYLVDNSLRIQPNMPVPRKMMRYTSVVKVVL